MTDAVAPGLHRSSDERPGIRRVRRGRGFAYVGPDGRPLRDEAALARIRALAIPPAYTDVWICPDADGHLQATGRDARGRKQYRYHAAWREARERDKFAQLAAFGTALPRLRRRVARDLAADRSRLRRGDASPSRGAVLAALVRLLDTTYARIGNDEYARENGSYGLTTLRNGHARVEGARVLLSFKGKSGQHHALEVVDPQVAAVVRRCQGLPGRALFEWRDDDGAVRTLSSDDVNAYLREASGVDVSAKVFRTWHASALALDLLRGVTSDRGCSRHQINAVLADVAGRLGNTVAVCRKSYVHPQLLAQAADDRLSEFVKAADAARSAARAASRAARERARRVRGLPKHEQSLLDFLARVPAALAEADAALGEDVGRRLQASLRQASPRRAPAARRRAGRPQAPASRPQARGNARSVSTSRTPS